MVSKPLINKINDSKILSDVYHSDHCPVKLNLNL
jgi:exonuclease III